MARLTPTLDGHCHIWTLARGDYGWLEGEGGPLDALRRDFAPGDYPGTARMIVVQAAPSVAETEFLLAVAAGWDRIAGVVGWVDLASTSAADDLHRLARDPMLRGIRPMLQDIAQTDWLLRAPRPEALAALADLGLTFDALVTTRHLPALAAFAQANPALPIVIDHAAKPQPGARLKWQAGMARLAAIPRLRCKLSGLMTELSDLAEIEAVFAQLLHWFGPDRLIWGSDWPVLTLAAGLDDWQALTDRLLAPLTDSARAAILGHNAATFYGVRP